MKVTYTVDFDFNEMLQILEIEWCIGNNVRIVLTI